MRGAGDLLRVWCALAAALAFPATAVADGALENTWTRHGFAEAKALAVLDADGSGEPELIYGGRKLAALPATGPAGRAPVWTMPWSIAEPTILVGTDNSWTTGLATHEVTGDGVDDLFVTTSDTDAYLVDGATGDRVWHRWKTGGGISFGFAQIDAPGDAVPDLFPGGGNSAYSGATGELLWTATDVPKPARSVASARLNAGPERDVVLAITPPSGNVAAPSVYGYAADGTKLWGVTTVSVVRSLGAGDLDGDGRDETVAGTYNGTLVAISPTGTVLWTTSVGDGPVDELTVGDADGDGNAEIFAMTSSQTGEEAAFHVAALDGTSAAMWRHPVGEYIRTLELEQLDGDAPLELLVGAGRMLKSPTLGSALALETGLAVVSRERWRVPTHEAVLSFARIGDRIYFSSAEGKLHAVDRVSGQSADGSWLSGSYVWALSAGDVGGDGRSEVARGDDMGHYALTGTDGAERWSHRLDGGNNSQVNGVAFGDADGAPGDEVAAVGQRFDLGDGVAELVAGDGRLLWSVQLEEPLDSVRLADVDGDGRDEVIVAGGVLEPSCVVAALDEHDGSVLWRTPISGCLDADIDVGDVDGDGSPEIAYGELTLADPPYAALLRADGTPIWSFPVSDQIHWVRVVDGAMLAGGYGNSAMGAISRRAAADGSVVWRTMLPDDPDLGSGSRFSTQVPDRDGDGFDEIAVAADDGAVYLLSGADGATVWSSRLEPADLDFIQRHQAGPLTYLTPRPGAEPRLVAGQWSIRRPRGHVFSLDLDGAVLGSHMVLGKGIGAATLDLGRGAQGAAVGAGLGVYGYDACPGCPPPPEPTPAPTITPIPTPDLTPTPTATPTPAPTATATPTPSPRPESPRTRPPGTVENVVLPAPARDLRVSLRARRSRARPLRLTTSDAARVNLVLRRCRQRCRVVGQRVMVVPAGRTTITARSLAGRKRLPRGRYLARLVVIDSAAKGRAASPLQRRFKLR